MLTRTVVVVLALSWPHFLDGRSSRGTRNQRRNSRLMKWDQLNSNIQEIDMPETDHYDVSTAEITNKLTQLKLVKDRSSKDIDTNQNEEETKKLETRTSLDDNTDDDEDKDPTTDKEESVCVKKVMQVPRTVWEDKIVCQHKLSEKCHTTFLTDYVPTQERKCHTSYNKRCRITYKPSVTEEKVSVCRDSLEKSCSEDTVGETVCKTIYQTQCNTRYNEMTMEEDQPVCELTTQTKCELTANQTNTNNDVLPNFVNNVPNCVDWPVKKCRLEKKLVKKVKPETWCEKYSQNVCAPSNCIISTGKRKCQDETKPLLTNIPVEDCQLEPQEDCRMETVLVPRLVEKPKCIKVPREVCVKQRVNPKKTFKPVIREWCYRPSQFKAAKNRNIKQFDKNSLF